MADDDRDLLGRQFPGNRHRFLGIAAVIPGVHHHLLTQQATGLVDIRGPLVGTRLHLLTICRVRTGHWSDDGHSDIRMSGAGKRCPERQGDAVFQ